MRVSEERYMNRSLRSAVVALAAVGLFVVSVSFAADDHYKKGFELFKAKNYTEAAQELEQSADKEAQYMLAVCYKEMKAWDKMIEPLKKVLASEPGKVEKDARMMLGFAYMKKSDPDYAKAAEALAAAVKL